MIVDGVLMFEHGNFIKEGVDVRTQTDKGV